MSGVGCHIPAIKLQLLLLKVWVWNFKISLAVPLYQSSHESHSMMNYFQWKALTFKFHFFFCSGNRETFEQRKPTLTMNVRFLGHLRSAGPVQLPSITERFDFRSNITYLNELSMKWFLNIQSINRATEILFMHFIR